MLFYEKSDSNFITNLKFLILFELNENFILEMKLLEKQVFLYERSLPKSNESTGNPPPYHFMVFSKSIHTST